MSSFEGDSAEPLGLPPTLVVTKTSTPLTGRGLIRRRDLLDRLTDQHNRQVTLLQAPAGYGKSTLLMQWVKADPLRRFGWVTLEKTENDPVLLWHYILYALQALAPGLAEEARSLLAVPNPDLRAVVSQVVNALADSPGRLVLVLDDYHVITNQACHGTIQYLLDHMPESVQIAFGTRVSPPLTLSKLSANGLVLEIDATLLQFTIEETRTVLDRSTGRVSSGQAATIQRDTEGWPVGVFLLGKTVGGGRTAAPVSDGRQAIRAYLIEEMLNQLHDDHRSALIDWSITGRFNGDLADRVSGRDDSARLLEDLAQTNLLLMTLDEQGDWYRFHDLLRDELQHEFGLKPESHRNAVHSRAAGWYLESGDQTEAIHHALEAHEYQRAGELICVNWFTYMLTGHLHTLREWFDRFPREALLEYPPILIVAAWVFSFSGDVEKTHRFAVAATKASYDGPMLDGATSFASAVALLRASLGHYGMIDANIQAEIAYQLEPIGAPWRPMAATLAGVTRYGLGRTVEAKMALVEGARVPEGLDGVAIYARGQLALIALSDGDWEEASRQADDACETIQHLHIGNVLSSGAAQIAAAAVAAHAGKAGLASQRLGSFARVLETLSDAIPFDAFQLHLVAAETELSIGNPNAATVHARSASAYLDAFGDGGVFEQRLRGLLEALGPSDVDDFDSSSIDPERTLTDRELQILALLPTHLSLREIGDQLYVSRNTVKTHVAHLYKKLGAADRSAAIARGRQLDLI